MRPLVSISRAAVLALPALLLASPTAQGQSTKEPPGPPRKPAARPAAQDWSERVRALERRLEQERRARAEANAVHEKRIAELERQLEQMREKQREREEQDELQKLLEMAEGEGPPPAPRPQTTMAILNPNISVIPDFVARSLSVNIDGSRRDIRRAFPELFDDQNPFRQREVEIDMRAPVSPDADAVAILSVGDEEPAAFEEVYVVLRNLPFGLVAKVGKFLLDFGRANLIHQHDLPQTDRPIVDSLLFGPEGTKGPGVSLSKTLHQSAAVGTLEPAHLEWTVEAINAVNEESPIFGRGGMDNEPAVNTRLGSFWQIDENDDLEVGASVLAVGRNRKGESGKSLVAGLDATWRRKRSRPGAYDGWLVQGEIIGSSVDTRRDGTVGAAGGYLTVQRQMDPQTYLGVRLDRAQAPTAKNAHIFGVAPYVSYYLNEFLRLRLQYTYRRASAGSSNATSSGLSAQLTWVFGAHPPEPYWVNR